MTPDGTELLVLGDPGTVNVADAEGPVGGCVPASSMSEQDQEAAIAAGRIELAGVVTLQRIGGLLQAMNDAHASGDVAFLLGTVDPLVIARYGRDQGETYVAGIAGTVSGLSLPKRSYWVRSTPVRARNR